MFTGPQTYQKNTTIQKRTDSAQIIPNAVGDGNGAGRQWCESGGLRERVGVNHGKYIMVQSVINPIR